MGSRIQVQIDCRMIAVEKGENFVELLMALVEVLVSIAP
jgi:hypothetical protein